MCVGLSYNSLHLYYITQNNGFLVDAKSFSCNEGTGRKNVAIYVHWNLSFALSPLKNWQKLHPRRDCFFMCIAIAQTGYRVPR